MEFIELSEAVEFVSSDSEQEVLAALEQDWRRSSSQVAKAAEERIAKAYITPGTVAGALRNGVACAAQLEDTPTIVDAPFGPAHVAEPADSRLAVERLLERLRDDEGAVVAVDLEGVLKAYRPKIDLIQVAIEGNAQWPSLCYVFNVHRDRGVLVKRGSSSLRAILEGASVKVLHCCRGDAAALSSEFGIHMQNAFDTAVADSVLRGRHHNTQRGLSTVLFGHLGEEVVHLTHKGKLVHTPGMFQEWPLPESLFVYAYEDVTYLGALYRKMQRELTTDGAYELVLEYTRQRCVPAKQKDAPPDLLVIALTDGQSVVGLERMASSRCPPKPSLERRASLSSNNSRGRPGSTRWGLHRVGVEDPLRP